MKKLSIIVPVYNLAKCLEQCSAALFKQDLPESEYEVVFVDDGSSDESLSILRKIEGDNNNVKIITQPNSRQGAARNNGVANASGEYVFFVDGDDYLALDSLSALYGAAKQNNLDILFFNIDRLRIGGAKVPYFRYKKGHIGIVYGGCEYLRLREMTLGPWYVFRRSFLLENNLKFAEKTRYEDSEFMLKACLRAQRIMNLDCVPYIYAEREGSTVSGASLGKTLDCQTILNRILEMRRGLADPMRRRCISYYAAMFFNTLYYNFRIMRDSDKLQFSRENTMDKREIIRVFLDAGTLKYFAEAVYLSLFWSKIFRAG